MKHISFIEHSANKFPEGLLSGNEEGTAYLVKHLDKLSHFNLKEF